MNTTWDDPTVPMNGTMKKQMLKYIYRQLCDIDAGDIQLLDKEDTTKLEGCIQLVEYLIDGENRGRYS